MQILDVVFLALMGVTILAYCVNSRSNLKHWKLVVLFTSLMFTTTVTAFSLTTLFDVGNNLFIFHVYTPIEYSILAFLYLRVFQDKRIKKILWLSIPAFVMLSAILTLSVQPVEKNNSLMNVLESVLIITWSMLYIREIIVQQQASTLECFPMFWISAGLLFYFVGSQLIEGLLNSLMDESMAIAQKVYRLMYLFRFTLMIMFIIGCFCQQLFKDRFSHRAIE